MGSAPQTSKYWFEGALICLVPRLDQPDVATKAMADAVPYAKDCHGRTTFNAVLISIIHFVLLKRFPDGSVEHTKTLPLFNTRGDACKDAQQRYDDLTLAELLGNSRGNAMKREIVRRGWERDFDVAALPESDRQGHLKRETARREWA
ncbi:MAG: hypothetical protein Q9204_007946 [Flavoplaca sp. TL-2023a]